MRNCGENVIGMWGVCFLLNECDGQLVPSELFQAVVQYEISEDQTAAVITYPMQGVRIATDMIMPLKSPPRFVVGDLVSPANHPEKVGVIREVGWHFNKNAYIYFISIDGKKKHKRYYSDDLIKQQTDL